MKVEIALLLSNIKENIMKTFAVLFICLLNFNFLQAQMYENIDEITPFNEDFAAIRKNEQWAFMNKTGEIVINFRGDLVATIPENEDEIIGQKHLAYPHFKEGKCLIRKKIDGIYYFGFIDANGKEVIEPNFVNATNFSNGKAIVVKFEKIPVGDNDLLEKRVVTYRLAEFVIDTDGKTMATLFNFRKIVPKVVEGEIPPAIKSKFLGSNLIASQFENGKWQIDKI
jgi:hypothetical protein